MADETLYDREPVRLPAWTLGPLSVLFGLASDLLLDVAWRPALAGALVSLGAILGIGEVARRRAVSPVTAERTAERRAIAARGKALADVRSLVAKPKGQTRKAKARRPTAPAERTRKRS